MSIQLISKNCSAEFMKNDTIISLKDLASSIDFYEDITEIIAIRDFKHDIFFDFDRELPDSITTLNFQFANIYGGKLPKLPKSLKILVCGATGLTCLPKLPDSLEELYCWSNKLIELPKLPSSLKHLYCQGNELSYLPMLPDSLITLDYSGNINIILYQSLPLLPLSLTYFSPSFECTFPQNQKCIKSIKSQHKTLKKYVLKIENWYLECKYNPEYKYCQNRLKLEFEEMYDVGRHISPSVKSFSILGVSPLNPLKY